MRLILCSLAGMAMLTACHTDPIPQVQVTGQASMKVVPDMVELSLKAYAVQPAMKDAVKETQAEIDQILAVCHRYISDPEDIKVSNIATDKDYEEVGHRDVFKGYSAQQVLEVRLRNIRQIQAFAEDLMATKINSIEYICYGHSKADSIQRVVNLMALADARKTAEKMCEKMNTGLGKITYLSNYAPGGQPAASIQSGGDYSLNLYSKAFGGRGFTMTTEILEFRDIAYAGFEIRQ